MDQAPFSALRDTVESPDQIKAAAELRVLQQIADFRENVLSLEITLDDREVPDVVAALAAELMQNGIAVLTDDGTPFGKPYKGPEASDALKARLDAERFPLVSSVNDATRNRVRFLLKKTPMEVIKFRHPTPLNVVQDAIKEGRLKFSEKNRAAYCSLIRYRNGVWSNHVTLPLVDTGRDLNNATDHYGPGGFEGIGCERTQDGRMVIFQLEKHYERFCQTITSSCLEPIPFETFKHMIIEVVQANIDYIPPAGEGRLYLRPVVTDPGPKLGVDTSGETMISITAFAIGNLGAYYGPNPEFGMALNHARVDDNRVEGKIAGLYALTIPEIRAAKKSGLSGVVYTEPSGERVTECNASAVFFVRYEKDEHGNPKQEGKHKLIIPSRGHRDILQSITVDSITAVASDLKQLLGLPFDLEVEWRDVSVRELQENPPDEAAVAGTGAGIDKVTTLKLFRFGPKNEIEFHGVEIRFKGHYEKDEQDPHAAKTHPMVIDALITALFKLRSGEIQHPEVRLTEVIPIERQSRS